MDLREKVRNIPDFPKPGIMFRDITTLLKDGEALRTAIDQLAAACRPFRPDLVVSPEARGFIVGVPLAYQLGTGFVPVRKAGKLPAETLKGQYVLEYGTDTLEIHKDAIEPGQRVVVVDDLLATGGTIAASIDLVKKLGGEVSAVAFLIELVDLAGRQALRDYEVISLIHF